MSYWVIEVQYSNNSWHVDGQIPRPNENLELETISTETTVKLANGGEANVTPEVRSLKQPFNMTWIDASSSFRTQIANYIDNRETVRITTHLGETFIGRFTSIKRVWLTGVSPDQIDIQITFKRLN